MTVERTTPDKIDAFGNVVDVGCLIMWFSLCFFFCGCAIGIVTYKLLNPSEDRLTEWHLTVENRPRLPEEGTITATGSLNLDPSAPYKPKEAKTEEIPSPSEFECY
jgi:hypothetical protein